MNRPLGIFCVLASAFCLVTLGGCADKNTAISHGHNTALDSANLIEMTEDMTAKILADPEVQSQLTQKGRLKVVIQRVEYRMVGEVLPRGA